MNKFDEVNEAEQFIKQNEFEGVVNNLIWRIEKLFEQLEKANDDNESKDTEIAELNDQIDGLKNQVSELEDDNENLGSELREAQERE